MPRPIDTATARTKPAPEGRRPDPGDADTGPQSLLSVTGHSYFPLALAARLPYAMMVVGTLTLVVAGRGSLGLGGLTSAMVGLGTVCFGPLIGAAADRWGQRRVLLAAAAVNSACLLALTAAVYSPLGDWSVLAAAYAIGATAPQVPPMSRSRLVAMITTRFPVQRRPKILSGTMAYESAADEIIFVVGPLFVGLLAAALGPAAPMFAAAALTLFFVTGFALHRSAEQTGRRAESAETAAPVRELFAPALMTAVIGVLGVGMIFGGTLTALTSLMSDAGEPERAGLLYSAMGIGSAVLALAVAAFPSGFSLRARWVVFGCVIAAGATGLWVATGLPLVIASFVTLGIGIGPTLVTLFSFVVEHSPAGRSATAMSMATTGIVVGQSASAAVTGQLGEHLGTGAASLVPLAAAALVLVAGIVNWLLVGRR